MFECSPFKNGIAPYFIVFCFFEKKKKSCGDSYRVCRNLRKKKKNPVEEKQAYYRENDENKHLRRFDPIWQNSRPWLVDTENGLICLVCTEFGPDQSC